MSRVVKVYKLGLISFNNALKIQYNIAQTHFKGMKEKKNNSSDTLLLLEHRPVYTVGIRRKEYAETEEKLKNLGADFVQTDRGGLITFHGPGQLVAYPIINLKGYRPSMKWYVCQLEQCVINLCKKLNITATTSPHTGVWVGEDKIAAIGIRM
uniref:lipoyl(octanoyl) transferase n=1 Tax=Strigamia maritima TaxID=126957 RepID=T1J567_STRMM